jgi:hypothetical protein
VDAVPIGSVLPAFSWSDQKSPQVLEYPVDEEGRHLACRAANSPAHLRRCVLGGELENPLAPTNTLAAKAPS